MSYSEAAYFDGNHCQHVADYVERNRLASRRTACANLIERRTGSRAHARG